MDAKNALLDTANRVIALRVSRGLDDPVRVAFHPPLSLAAFDYDPIPEISVNCATFTRREAHRIIATFNHS